VEEEVFVIPLNPINVVARCWWRWAWGYVGLPQMAENNCHRSLISAAPRDVPPSSLEKAGHLPFIELPGGNVLVLHPAAQVGCQAYFVASGFLAIALLGEAGEEALQVGTQRSGAEAGRVGQLGEVALAHNGVESERKQRNTE